MRLSIIVPFHRNLAYLESCLAALDARPADSELIVVADGAVDDCRPLVERHGGRVVDVPRPLGPAGARNRGAFASSGDVLLFVDYDVVAPAAHLERLQRLLAGGSGIDAVFGSYDEAPADAGFMSQYKNLSHAFVHQTAKAEAHTFWTGFGGVRRSAFMAIGGFDERFLEVEDIELGHRLAVAGFRIRLERDLRVCHLKRWTFRSLVASDMFDRGIPWMQLILRTGRMPDDLNLRARYRASMVLAYLAAALALGSVVAPVLLAAAAVPLGALVFLNRDYYEFFRTRRGLWFAVRVVPMNVLYHLYNGVSASVGTALFLCRRLGLELPGSLPLDIWDGNAATRKRRAAPAGAAADQPTPSQE